LIGARGEMRKLRDLFGGRRYRGSVECQLGGLLLGASLRAVRDIVAQQVELQLHGIREAISRIAPRGGRPPCAEWSAQEKMLGTPGGMISPRVPPSGSAVVCGVVDAEEQSVESVKSV